MGKILSVASAYALMLCRMQIFRNPPEVQEDESKIPTYIFLTAFALLLYDLRLYPKSLRKLDSLSQMVLEFFIAMFFLETVYLDFWLSMENGAKTLPQLAGDTLESVTENNEQYKAGCDYLRTPIIKTGFVIVVSIFFLLAVLHAIRAVDFRAIDDGYYCFFKDIFDRLSRCVSRKLRAVGIGRKRVMIKECCGKCGLKGGKSDSKGKKKKSSSCKRVSSFDDISVDDSFDNDSIKFADYDIPDDEDLLLCEGIGDDISPM